MLIEVDVWLDAHSPMCAGPKELTVTAAQYVRFKRDSVVQNWNNSFNPWRYKVHREMQELLLQQHPRYCWPVIGIEEVSVLSWTGDDLEAIVQAWAEIQLTPKQRFWNWLQFLAANNPLR